MADARRIEQWNQVSALMAMQANCQRTDRNAPLTQPESFHPYAECNLNPVKNCIKVPVSALKGIFKL